MKKLFGVEKTGSGAQLCIAGSKHHELQLIGRFWYREIRYFLNSKRTVKPVLLKTPSARGGRGCTLEIMSGILRVLEERGLTETLSDGGSTRREGRANAMSVCFCRK
jgi:hypothetical protein